MAEYMDKEAFKKSVEERYCKPCKAEGKDHNGCWCRACWVDDMLNEVECFQTADVDKVVHGRWEQYLIPNILCCSNCDWGIDPLCKSTYCPKCGAKMNIKDGGDNDAVD